MLSSDDLVDFHFVEEDRIIVLEPEAELPPPDDPPPAIEQVEKGMQADDAVAGQAFEELAMLREELEVERRRSKSLIDENTQLEFEVERLRKDAVTTENVRAQSLQALERKVALLRENARLENLQLTQKKALKDLCTRLRRMTGIVIGMAVVLGVFTLVSAIMSASLLEKSRGKERHSDEEGLLSKLDLQGEGDEGVPVITADNPYEEDFEFEPHSFSLDDRLDRCEQELEILRDHHEEESRRCAEARCGSETFMGGVPMREEESVMARLHSLIPGLVRNNMSVAVDSGPYHMAIHVWAQRSAGDILDANQGQDRDEGRRGQVCSCARDMDHELDEEDEATGYIDDDTFIIDEAEQEVPSRHRHRILLEEPVLESPSTRAAAWRYLSQAREEATFWASVFNDHEMTSAQTLQPAEAGSEKQLLPLAVHVRVGRRGTEQPTQEDVVEEQQEEEAEAAAMDKNPEVPKLVSEACQQPEACQVAKYSVLHVRQLQTQRLRNSVRFSSENHWSLSNAIRLWLQAAPENPEETHQWRMTAAKTQLPPRFLGVTLDTPAPASLESDHSPILAAYDEAQKSL